MADAEMQRQKIEHAKWKVQFITSLLDMNKGFVFHMPQRDQKEKELLVKLADAQSELERLQAERL